MCFLQAVVPRDVTSISQLLVLCLITDFLTLRLFVMLCSFAQISEVSRPGGDSNWNGIGFSLGYYKSQFIRLTSVIGLRHITEHRPLGEVICAKTEAANDDG